MEILDKYKGISFDNGSELNTDLVVIDSNTNEVIFASVLGYDSHVKQTQKVIKTNKQRSSVYFNSRYYTSRKDYKILSKKVKQSNYTHAIISAIDSYEINGSDEAFTNYIFLTNEDELQNEVYKRLVKYSSVPMLEEWMPYIISKLQNDLMLSELEVFRYLPESGTITNFVAYKLTCNRSGMINIISEGLSFGVLTINGTHYPSELLNECRGIDSYLRLFGEGLAKKIQESFRPKFVPGEDRYDNYSINIDDYVHHHAGIELYEAQRSAIQAITNNMKTTNNTILVGEMGAGKTLMAAGSCYAHNSNKNKGFNALVMCPSHLLNNWKNEIERFIPNGKGYIIHNLEELLDLKPRLDDPYKVENTFVILSKEIAKIGYGFRPAALFKRVGSYRNEHNVLVQARNVFICPECGHVLTKEMNIPIPHSRRKRKVIVPLDILDFLKESPINEFCTNDVKVWDHKAEQYTIKKCNAKLWTALNRDDEDTKWIKLGANGWIMKDHIEIITERLISKDNLDTKESKLMDSLLEQYNSIQETGEAVIHYKGTKKYPIAKYIKERMYHTFDYACIDECHLLKGETEQGHAFHLLTKAAKKTLCLTGTLLNGYASSLYYILYRLFPQTMQNEGFKYNDVRDFSRIYGVYSNTSRITSDGRNIGTSKEKFLPGISSLVFTKFLMNNTVFVSLEDMTEGLPNYTEIPMAVSMDEETRQGYQKFVSYLVAVASERNLGKVGNVFRQMSMYPDAPHCASDIYEKETQELLFAPDILEQTTRNKDEQLLQLIEEKVDAGEKVLVYYNDVRVSDIGSHLCNLIRNKGYEAQELKASVKAENREAYINNLVGQGLDVLITNPTLVETGLNLLDFTTIIFYQIGYNLSTMRQASRRSWRLSQTKDITVYFLYYENTTQEDALSLMATKLHAAQSMEGKFSEEGLKAMSNNQDMLTQIAANVVDGIKNTVDQSLFASSNFVKTASNNERNHYKDLGHIAIKINEQGRRSLIKKNKKKVKPTLDNKKAYNTLNLFI